MTAMAIEARRRLEERRLTVARAAPSSESAARELVETDEALHRMDLGTYGRCETCGGAIGRQRLLALPTARFCIACASFG